VNSDLSLSEGETLSVKQKYIKRTALEIMKQHGDKVTEDFKANKEILDANSTIQGKLLRNRIAGYMVRLKRRELKPRK
jgi:small subunit ribosomal protein S17e